MKYGWKRLTAVLLVCSMSMGLFFSGNVFAAENDGTGTEAAAQTEDADNLDTASDENLTESDIENISAAAAYIREQMTQRETVITGSFAISDMGNMDSVFKTLADQIFICTSESDEGDYLKQHNGGMSWNYEAAFDGSVTTFSYELRTSYYTTLEQEQEVADRIDEVLAELSLDGLSDYEKTKKIYDYIAINVSYDYEHLSDSSYMLSHTAYAALIQETAVCQGYASLFYRMAHEAGLSVRIVTGLVDGEAHAWNIVKIGDLYYYVDTTHASSSGNRDDYFLKGSISFADRQLDSDYLSADFTSEFPMSDFDYSDDSGDTEVSSGELTDDIQWTVKSSTDEAGETTYYLELRGDGEMPDYAMTDELPWEEWRDEITLVMVGSGITKIGSYVFSGMNALTTVQIANTVTVLGEGAFYNCGKLTNLQIPDSVTSIGSFAVGGSYGETRWEYNPMEKKLTVTGNGVMGEPYVEGSTTEKNASRVPWNRYRDQIEEVVIEEGVTNLSTYALHGMNSLTAVTLPSTLEEIGEGSFESCTALTYICIPDSVKTIGHYAFRYCEGLRSIHIPASVTSIGVRAFADCAYLHEFYFYGDAPTFEKQAIMDSEYITVYYDGSGWSDVKSLFEYLTFETWEPGEYDDSGTNVSGEGIKSQTSGKYGDDIEWNYDEESAVLTLSGKGEMGDPITIVTVDETTNTTTTSYSTNAVPWNPFNQQIKEVVISDGITSISRYAFWWLTQIESITIPDSVITVGQQSFVHCSKLQTVTFGDDLTIIGKEAFKDCTALKEIYISDKLASVEESAFTGCETLADVYYEGSENEWGDIVIGEDNDPLINAEIHYNYGKEEPWIPDGAFSISKSGTWVSGKECAISGTYSASIEGNVESEAEAIIWTSSDPSIIDTSNPVIDLAIPDLDKNRVTIIRSFNAKKAGTVTVTATAPDGRSTSVTIDVEPELVAVETEEKITEETEVTLFRAELDEPDAEYLEAFISRVEVEMVDSDDGAAEIKKPYFKIADDGLSATVNIVLTPIYDGTIELRGSSIGGQAVTVEVYTDTNNLRPGVIASSWNETDEWSFYNRPSEDAFGSDVTEGYYITNVDYDRLISKLSNTEKNAITFSQNLANATTQGVNIYRYNIDGLSANAHDKWGGSCYGMAVWACLVKSGILEAEDIEKSNQELYDYKCTNKVESAINYYHMQQYLPSIVNEIDLFMKNSPSKRFELLIEKAANFRETGHPVILGYNWFQSFKEDGTCDTEDIVGHAVVAYGVEDISPIEKQVLGTNYTYNHRILIYDNAVERGSEDGCVYYNDNGFWCIPAHDIVSNPNKATSGVFDRENNVILNLAISDPYTINSVDYTSGYRSASEQALAKKTILNAMSDASYTVEGKDFSVDISGIIASNSTSNEQINVSIATNITLNGNIGPTTASACLPESEYYTVKSYEDNMQFQLNRGGYLTRMFVDAPGSITFLDKGGASMVSDTAAEYCISLTANEGYYTLPWYTIEVTGSDTKEISAEWTDNGVLVTSDNLENVTVVGSNDDDTQEMTFSTDEDSVLVSESDNDLVVLVDTDDDGIYETDVNEKEEHVHTYGAPKFTWSADYTTCTAVFTCEVGDDEQKIECEVTSRTTEPTCTESGKSVYTATVAFDGTDYTDTKEKEIAATGHTYRYTDNGDDTHTKECTFGDDMTTELHTYQNGTCIYCGAEEPEEHTHEYGEPEFSWSEDYKSCTIVFTCESGDDEQRIECEVSSSTTDPTCTETGKTVYTAKGIFDGKEYTDVKEQEIPASGHAYGTPEFNWSKDYQTCTAIFTCESCDNEQKIECDITSETTDPTCTKDGNTVYTATASFAGKEYTDTQEEVISATGHTYEYTDNGDGTHTRVCTAGDDMVTEPHTYQDGTCTYCGAEEPEKHVHEYGIPEFKWSEDYITCTAVFTCKDGDDQQSIECEVTDEVTDATCTENGKAVYTAKVIFDDKEYTDVKEQEIPASGHAYGTPEFDWSEDYQTCTAVFTCESCDDEQKMECDITSETTEPTCTEDGKKVYTATVTFADKEYTDTQEEVIIATGHTYEYTDNGDGTHTKVCTAGDDTATEPHTYQDGICTYCGAEEPKEHVHEYGIPEFKWSEDYTTCTAVFTCKDGDDQQSIECEVTDEVTDPICTESGKTVYTAAVIFGGTDYTDTKETEIAATGHTYRYTDNGDGTHTKACTFGDDTVTEPHTYQNGICTYCGAEEPQGHVHTYGDPKFRWSEDNKSCTAVFTCIDGDDQQTAECTVTSRDNGDGTVTFTAEVEFNGESYTDTRMVKISEEPDVPGGAEEPEGPVPGDNTSDSNDKPGKPADGTAGAFDNRTDGNVETGVKTGDDNSILLWSMMLAAATIGAGIISFGKKKRAVK